MKYCPYCGAELHSGAVFYCSACGKKLAKHKERPAKKRKSNEPKTKSPPKKQNPMKEPRQKKVRPQKPRQTRAIPEITSLKTRWNIAPRREYVVKLVLRLLKKKRIVLL